MALFDISSSINNIFLLKRQFRLDFQWNKTDGFLHDAVKKFISLVTPFKFRP